MTTSCTRHSCRALIVLTALLAAAPAAAGWEPLGGPAPLGVQLQHAPSAPASLYASVLAGEYPRQSFVWRSDDSGLTWRSLQPGLLLGPRGGDRRPGERIAIALSPLANLFLRGRLVRYAAIGADLVAGAAVNALAQAEPGIFRHDNRSLRRLAAA